MLRRPNRRDLDQMVELERKCHEELGLSHWGQDNFLAFLQADGTRAYVLCDEDNDVIGQLLLDYQNPRVMFITRLSVDPEFRRKGCGAALLAEAFRIQDYKLEREEMLVDVVWKDLASQAFYKKFGFQSQASPNDRGITFSRILSG